jgi:hypothetical protein
MNISVLPEKHVRASESLIGLGAFVLRELNSGPKNLDTLWASIKEVEALKSKMHGSVTLDTLVLSLDFLFAVGAVNLSEEGLIGYASY